MADFAKAQLLKYGWTEGKGLGKNENGIIQPLKPKLKFDTTGVGHKDNWEEWWATAFNKAANSITIESQTHGVSISSKATDDDSSKKNSKRKGKHSESYGNFLKTSTLYGDTLVQESKIDEVEGRVKADVINNPLTDEELFKACGGRTAHKGARHGLRLNGKLQRIAEQESKLLDTMMSKEKLNKLEEQHRESVNNEYEIDSNANAILPINLSPSKETIPHLSKSRRKKQKRRINNLIHQLNTICSIKGSEEETAHSTSNSTSKNKECLKRKSKEKKEECLIQDSVQEEIDGQISSIPLPEEGTAEGSDYSSVLKGKRKKSKRNKSKNRQGKNTITIEVDKEIEYAPSLKKARKSTNAELGDLARLLNDDDDEGINLSDSEKYIFEKNNTFSKTKSCHLSAQMKRKKDRLGCVDKITECLKAVHFDTDQNTKTESHKKKFERMVDNLVTIYMAENKTEDMKKAAKKKKKKSKK